MGTASDDGMAASCETPVHVTRAWQVGNSSSAASSTAHDITASCETPVHDQSKCPDIEHVYSHKAAPKKLAYT